MGANSARQRAYSHLRRRILRLEAPPGSALSESEVASALGMSRTPVREAMLLLVEEGLVEVRPQVGTFVSRINKGYIAHAQFLREAVELASLRCLEAPLDERVLDSLRTNLIEQAASIDMPDRFLELDDAFHAGLMTLAGHGPTWATVAAAKAHLDRVRRLRVGDTSTAEDRLAEHRAVLDVVIQHDIEHAVDLMRRHLRVVLDEIRTIERESPHLLVTNGEMRALRDSAPIPRN